MKKSIQLSTLLLSIFTVLFMSSCKDDNDAASGTFTVTIENTMEARASFQSGALPNLMMPGDDYSFSFDAGKGMALSFATMFVQTNDVFYAFDDTGLDLYDANGNAVTGNVSSSVLAWDSGTEVNEEPGVGENQAPRQTGPNMGTDENGTIELIGNINDGFTYPANADIITVELSHDGGTRFTAKITNISGSSALPTPFAPGVWSVHAAGTTTLLKEGAPASNYPGLEAVAEDGSNTDLLAGTIANTGLVSPFAPGAYAVFQGTNPIFVDGTLSSDALEALAEDGNPAGYTNVFNTPDGASAPAPIFPGESYSFTFDAKDGDWLSFATMFIQSNDLFVAPEGINLFPNGTALSGDITSQSLLWDSYTEVNEFPGAGNNQAPRQTGANTGASESANVALVNDSYTYPAVNDMLSITITAN